MITYELAKQLKDAGFPQSGRGNLIKANWIDMEIAYKPTLEELIEACGNGFILFKAEKEWCSAILRNGIQEVAYDSNYIDEKYDHFNVGQTPSIAVALLWLELNKKR